MTYNILRAGAIADLPTGYGVAHNGTETSRAAASSAVDVQKSARAALVAVLTSVVRGATCDELEYWLDLSHQTASAAVRALVIQGKIRYTDEKRPTRTGRMARVLEACPESSSARAIAADANASPQSGQAW